MIFDMQALQSYKPSHGSLSVVCEKPQDQPSNQSVTRSLSELEIVQADTRPLGNFGRLYCPAVGVNVAVNAGARGTGQSICDAADSAVTQPYGVERQIADHAYQGFGAISGIGVGTKVYLKKPGGIIEIYSCTGGGIAIKSIENTIFYLNGQSLMGMNAGGIFLSTCVDNTGTKDCIRFLQRVG